MNPKTQQELSFIDFARSEGRFSKHFDKEGNPSATLLGLLGTLFGLMKSFSASAKLTGSAKSTALAAGISEALTATSFGLGTALMCLLSYGVLVMKQTAIVDDINRNGARLIDLLYTRKMKIKGGGSSVSQPAAD